MRLVRYGDAGIESPAVLIDGKIIDVESEFSDFNEGFFACDGLTALKEWVEDGCPGGYEVDPDVRIGAPIARPSKIVGVGKNYAAHAKEFGGEVPSEPVLFLKASSSFSGPFDSVVIPAGSKHLDYEVELAIIIGSTAKNVSEENAAEYIAGYSVIGDYSERQFQKHHGGQWTKGKSADTFTPMGPHLVTSDEMCDVDKLRIWTKVNTELRQNSWTGDMLFKAPFLVSYISKFMTLLPGDVICTGTPEGVGMAMNPPSYLQAGDCVDMGIENIGKISQGILADS